MVGVWQIRHSRRGAGRRLPVWYQLLQCQRAQGATGSLASVRKVGQQDAADTLNELLESDAGEEFKHVGRLRLAKVMLYQGKTEEVVSLLEAHSDSNAFAARYAETLGDAFVELGRFEDAREAYQRALGESSQAATVDQNFVQLKLLDLPLEATPMAAENAGDASGDDVADTASDEVAE